jgi:DNA-binding transcriptional MerR regulator
MALAELTDYFELQVSTEMVTKTELRQGLRDQGLAISDRNLTYYSSIGLVPPAIRIGSRSAAYPRVVVEQLAWVVSSRKRGLSLDAIKELLPLWQSLVGGRTRGVVDLNEFELLARSTQLTTEANYAIPSLVSDVITCLCGECLQQINWVLKDHTTFHHTEAEPLKLSFLLGGLNEETGQPQLVAWTQLSFPGLGHPDPASPTSIVLGLPVGVQLPLSQTPKRKSSSSHRSCNRRTGRQREALPLGGPHQIPVPMGSGSDCQTDPQL